MRELAELETARRKCLDEENRKLRDDLLRFKSGDFSLDSASTHTANLHHFLRHQTSSAVSHTSSFDRPASAASSTLAEQLIHENADLRRDLGAQIMLTNSRNNEKACLYQEIEELKLAVRGGEGSRSVTGDSILERSVSRAHGRSASRVSELTKSSVSDNEREQLEIKIGQLRDQNSALKLRFQDLENKIDPLLDELEKADWARIEYDNLVKLRAEDSQDLQTMQSERDEALKNHEEIEAELQELRANANDRVNALEEELDQKCQTLQSLEADISNQAEQSEALAKEVRSLNERMQRVGEEMESRMKKIEELEIEIEVINRETETIDKKYNEEMDKNARLTIHQESREGEIMFLRGEQEENAMRIGDLESTISSLTNSLSSEKERAKDLDCRLAEERNQRELIESQEKQEVQKIMIDLNREASDAKEESRKLKKNLQASEIEATAVKERLMELESNLRGALGDSNGTRSSFLTVCFHFSIQETSCANLNYIVNYQVTKPT